MTMQPRLWSHQIERFLNPMDSFQVSIWERTHRECLEKGLEHGKRLDKTSITLKKTKKSDFFYHQLSKLVTAQSFLFICGATLDAYHCPLTSEKVPWY